MSIAPAWRLPLVGLAVTVCVVVLALQDSVASLWRLWNHSDSYGHGLFVLPLVAYSVWILRDELSARAPRTAWLGLIAVAGSAAVWVIAVAAEIEVGHQVAFFCVVTATVVALFGWRIAGCLWFPLLFPFLSVPIWDAAVPLLQDHTARVTAMVVRWLGVPLYLEGFFIAIPSGNFEIAEVCAGLRYLLAMAAIATFYAFLNGLTFAAGVGFVALGLAWSILFNWIRVVTIVVVGHVSEMQSGLVHDHYTFGWILFAVALAPLFYAGRWFKVAPVSPPQTAIPAGVSLARLASHTVAVCLMVVVAMGLASQIRNADVRLKQPPNWPKAIADWNYVGPSQWRGDFPGAAWADAVIFRRADGATVEVYVAAYAAEAQGQELINTQNQPYKSSLWRVTSAPRSVSTRSPFRESGLQSSSSRERRIVWHTYRVSRMFEGRREFVKLLQIQQTLLGRPAGASLALVTDGAPGSAEARLRLESFSRDASAVLGANLDQVLGW